MSNIEDEINEIRANNNNEEYRHSHRPRVYTVQDSDGNSMEEVTGFPPRIFNHLLNINRVQDDLKERRRLFLVEAERWLFDNKLDYYYDLDEPTGPILVRKAPSKSGPGWENWPAASFMREVWKIKKWINNELKKRDNEEADGKLPKPKKRLTIAEALELNNPQPKKPKQIRIAKGYDKRPIGKAPDKDDRDPSEPNPYAI